jgi:hypothetical protein
MGKFHFRYSRLARDYQEVIIDYLAREAATQNNEDVAFIELEDGHILDFCGIEGKETPEEIFKKEILSKFPEAILLEIIPLRS